MFRRRVLTKKQASETHHSAKSMKCMI